MSMLRWVFTLSAAPGTLALRGLPEQLALAVWLVAKLDLQADRQTAERNEYLAFRSIPSAAKAAEQLIAKR